jgi:tripartite-type tricarboxylate transporter receptor subunit TctC
MHVLAAEVFALRLVCRAAKAQDYPTRPEKLIVAYAAGHSMIGE